MLTQQTAYGSQRMLFNVLDRSEGLSDNRVRTIGELPDGRMVFATGDRLDIYDGSRFGSFDLFPDSLTSPLPGYTGYHFTFVDGDTLLWVKDRGRVSCFDLRTERHMAPPVDPDTDDIFADGTGGLWIRSGLRLTSPDDRRVTLDPRDGEIQDLRVDGDTLYLFFSSGRVVMHDLAGLSRLGHRDPYPASEAGDFGHTSLVRRGPRGFYQLRNGSKGGLFFFDTSAREWHRLMETGYGLNTLFISGDSCARIASARGVWNVDLATGTAHITDRLSTTGGNILSTIINTIYEDRDGGLWLGTYNRGLLYASPGGYVSHTIAAPGLGRGAGEYFAEDHDGHVYLVSDQVIYAVSDDGGVSRAADVGDLRTRMGPNHTFVASEGSVYFCDPDSITIFSHATPTPRKLSAPLAAGIWLHGDRVEPGMEYGGRVVLDHVPSRSRAITLGHDQNYLTLEYVVPEYRSGVEIDFRCRLAGLEDEFVSVPEPSVSGGRFAVHYNNLPPGHYTLAVEARERGAGYDVPWSRSEMEVIVLAPWWRTPWAYVAYIVFAALVGVGAIALYTRVMRRRLERRHREEILLTRIRSLIEQCERYEQEKEVMAVSAVPERSASDNEFLDRAIGLVEANLDTPGYSVEQLSRDLCMERTGLYKKLTSLLDQSPSLFIRNIRLRRVADLLVSEPGMTVSEIAERTGFSSGSYLSKCFQETYGCRPSEYASRSAKTPKST
ncbi:MAG: helix-turn-helix domain-containing protein [Duncaniella sp.]|nr:helix-turn-helix domain-containing protein [Duncaniella sp.]